jgi:pre-mRNA-splicing factor CWC26
MQVYLADKYMSGPKADAILSRTAPKKKKKRKPEDAGSTSRSGSAMILDDDAGWSSAATPTNVEEDDTAEAVVASDRTFKKRRMEPSQGGEAGGSGWITVREPTPPAPADEQPVVVAMTTEEAPPAFRGGLLTKDLRGQLPTSHDRQKDEDEEDPEAIAVAQETVYRDASGRKLDMKLERAEAARKKREREEREAQKMEWGKGMVQKEEVEKRRREEERIRLSGFTRYANDEELNRTQKDQERWNDPAAAFMTVRFSFLSRSSPPHLYVYHTYRKREQRALGNPNIRVHRLPRIDSESSLDIGGMASVSRWYFLAFAHYHLNSCYNLDRGNGFEKKYFQKQNERRRTGAESHDWSVEDM